jgi:hypothetical protein
MSFSEVGDSVLSGGVATGFAPSFKGRSRVFHGGPNRETPKQRVKRLGLVVGMLLHMPDGVSRVISKIDSNGDVFVKGLRGRVNIYELIK